MSETAKTKHGLGYAGAWAFSFGCVVGWGAFVMPGSAFLTRTDTGGVALAIGAAALVMLLIALNYAYMLRHSPEAGGAFGFAKRAFGGDHAFICGWSLVLAYLSIAPLNAAALALIARKLLGGVFQLGFHYSVAGYDVYLGEIAPAAAVLILAALLCVRGERLAAALQTAMAAAMALCVFGVAAALLLNGVPLGKYAPEAGDGRLLGILGVFAVSPWAFVGFETIALDPGALRFSARKTLSVMACAVFAGAAVYVVLTAAAAGSLPPEYGSLTAWLDDLENLSGVASLPVFYTVGRALGAPGLAALSAAAVCAALTGVLGFFTAASRLIRAMSLAGAMRPRYAALDERYGAPRRAVRAVLAFSLCASLLGRTALGWIVDMASVGAAAACGYTSAAVRKLASAAGDKTMAAAGTAGAAFSALFLFLLLAPIPALGCSLGAESYICLVAWIALGVNFYSSSGE